MDKSATALVAEWRLKVMDKEFRKNIISGRLCLGIFQGMLEDEVDADMGVVSVDNTSQIDNPDALATALKEATYLILPPLIFLRILSSLFIRRPGEPVPRAPGGGGDRVG
eukprot:3708737-Pyramimonas_sp.AAC.1